MQTIDSFRLQDADPHYLYTEGEAALSSEYYLHRDLRRWQEKGTRSRTLRALTRDADEPPKQTILPVGAVFLEEIMDNRVVRERKKHVDRAWNHAHKIGEQHGNHYTPEEELVCYYCVRDRIRGATMGHGLAQEVVALQEGWTEWWWNYVCPTIIEQTRWLRHSQEDHEGERRYLIGKKKELEQDLENKRELLREYRKELQAHEYELERTRTELKKRTEEAAEATTRANAVEKEAELSTALRYHEQSHTVRLEDIIRRGQEENERRLRRRDRKINDLSDRVNQLGLEKTLLVQRNKELGELLNRTDHSNHELQLKRTDRRRESPTPPFETDD